ASICPSDQDFLDAGRAGKDAGAERSRLILRRIADGELERSELVFGRLQRRARRFRPSDAPPAFGGFIGLAEISRHGVEACEAGLDVAVEPRFRFGIK